MVEDGNDPEVTDAALRSEIELLTDVITAASRIDGRLTIDQLDEVLGLTDSDPDLP